MTDGTMETTTAIPSRATRRDLFASASLWLPVLAVSVTATLWYERLPAVLPKQWDASGVTSTASREVVIGVTGGFALLGAIIGLIAMMDAAARIRRPIVLVAGFMAGLAAGVWFVIAGLVLVTGSAEPDAGAWPLLGVLSGAYGLIPFALCTRRQADTEYRAAVPLELGAQETGAWFTTIRVPVFSWLAVIAGITTLAVIVFGISSREPGVTAAAVALLIVTVLTLGMSRIRVSVDRRGLRVVSSLLRLPIRRIELRSVDSADAETIRPLEWGGWGYRILPGRSALVLVSGPGIVVHRCNGTRFAVTVPEPEIPAALLTALARR